MAGARAQVSLPFASRELNGEVLLDELTDLRTAQVAQQHLTEVAVALRSLQGAHPPEAQALLRQLAAGRCSGQPSLAALLVRWSAKLKSELDVPALVSHFERLALTSLLLSALRRGAERLPRGVRR